MTINSKATLQEHQQVLFELLQVFDGICKKHRIRYQLFAGTALGAVRHQGFIPWDDDLDVVMLREDYERFMRVAEEDLDKDTYFLQEEFTKHWPMYFSKLRKNGTTCLERYIPRDPISHQGVYIDIFPCDNLAEHPLVRKMQYYAAKVVIAKALDRRGYLANSTVKKCFIAMCRLLPIRPFRSLVKCAGKGNSTHVHTFLGGGSSYEKNIYPRIWFLEEQELPFEKGRFPVSAHYDALLTAVYGDYKTPLPEGERNKKIHAEFVDLEHPYTRYLEQQKSMTFAEYSRSIR